MSQAKSHAADAGESPTKKALILEVARELAKPRYTPAEIEQIRRQLIANLGAHGKTSVDYIVSVLEEAGMRVVMSTQSDTEGLYEEEFSDLLHFSTLDEAEMCLVRLDELLRKFLAEGESAAAERVREVARLGRRRAEMIARNHKVDAKKRAEKEEIAQWFGIWLEYARRLFRLARSPQAIARFPRQIPAYCRKRRPRLRYLLDVEPLDLGSDVRAIGLELVEADENREPVRGLDAAKIWSRVLRAVTATDAVGTRFFQPPRSRPRLLQRHQIVFREASHRSS